MLFGGEAPCFGEVPFVDMGVRPKALWPARPGFREACPSQREILTGSLHNQLMVEI